MVGDDGTELWARQRKLIYAAIGGLCLIAAIMVVASLTQGINSSGTPEQIRASARAQQYGIPALGALFAGMLSVFLYGRPTWLRALLWIVGGLLAVAVLMLDVG